MRVDFSNACRITLFGDYVKAELDDLNVPRIPPMRISGELSYKNGNWDGDVGAVWYDDQTDTAPFETATHGYTLINAGLRYAWTSQDVD